MPICFGGYLNTVSPFAQATTDTFMCYDEILWSERKFNRSSRFVHYVFQLFVGVGNRRAQFRPKSTTSRPKQLSFFQDTALASRGCRTLSFARGRLVGGRWTWARGARTHHLECQLCMLSRCDSLNDDYAGFFRCTLYTGVRVHFRHVAAVSCPRGWSLSCSGCSSGFICLTLDTNLRRHTVANNRYGSLPTAQRRRAPLRRMHP